MQSWPYTVMALRDTMAPMSLLQVTHACAYWFGLGMFSTILVILLTTIAFLAKPALTKA